MKKKARTDDINVKNLTGHELVFYLQDINRTGREKIYTEEFKKAIHKEVLRRGK